MITEFGIADENSGQAGKLPGERALAGVDCVLKKCCKKYKKGKRCKSCPEK